MLAGDGPITEPLQQAIELLTPIDPAAAAYAHTRLAVLAGFEGDGGESQGARHAGARADRRRASQ